MHSPLEILSASFARDPWMAYIEPDPQRRPRVVEWLSRHSLRLGRQGGLVDLADGAGVGIWFPPKSDAFGVGSLIRAGFLSVPFTLGPAAARRLIRSETDLNTLARPDEAWYFYMLGVHPEAQGQGVARRLIERGLARVDADGKAARLETNNPKNVSLYERFGFTVTGHIATPGMMEQWVMVRPAP